MSGGLSASDIDVLAKSITQDLVCSKLRELGCTVKHVNKARGPTKSMPVAISFRWDAESSWYAGGLEEDLVKSLQDVLLQLTPLAHSDRESNEARMAKSTAGSGRLKSATGAALAGEEPSAKRAKVNVGTPSVKGHDGACSACGRCNDDPDGTSSLLLIPNCFEHWSTDVDKGNRLPCGGHVLAVSLPMYLDEGPAGRPPVDAKVEMTSVASVSPHRYVPRLTSSTKPAKMTRPVVGARFTTTDGPRHAAPSGAHSHDILRRLAAHIAERPKRAAVGTGQRSSADEAATPLNDVCETFRHASRSVPLRERIDFTSNYELATREEVVERGPGRMTIFCEGVEPLPDRGVFTV